MTAICNQASLQTRHCRVEGEGAERDVVGDWLVGMCTRVGEEFSLADATADYKKMVTDLDEAASTFEREVKYYLTKYAPVKEMIIKQSNKPFVSDETKDMISRKRQAWLQFKQSRDPLAHARFKSIAKSVKAAVNTDRNNWLSRDLDTGSTIRQAWAKAKLLLGKDRSTAPKSINSNNGPVTDPKSIANMFATHYSSKYSTLRSGCTMVPSKCPVERVREWLGSKGLSPPPGPDACQ